MLHTQKGVAHKLLLLLLLLLVHLHLQSRC
jgi:hypothetical protein